VKLLCFNDPHFSAVPPASRKSNYTDCMLNKLREVVDFANQERVDVLACTGDWFVSKRPEATPYWLAAEISHILRKFEGDKVTSIGNHDVQAGVESFNRSPLHMICQAAEIEYKTTSGILYDHYGVQIVVVNYDVDGRGFQSMCSDFDDDGEVRIVIAHTPIIPPYKEQEYPPQYVITAVKAQDLAGYADFIFYGDIHDYHGIYTLASKRDSTTFCNLGSLARNSATEIDSKRQVKVVLFDTETNQIQEVELENVLPVDQVFNVELRQEKKAAEQDMTKFIGSLDTSSLKFSVVTPDLLKARLDSDSLLDSKEKKLGLEAIQQTI
jgi:DNA repair exonuclease SbcCD nuclease subunit